jgi:hypothetical protein
MNATASSPTPSASAPTTISGLSPGARAGIGVGVALGVLSVVVALMLILYTRRRQIKYRAERQRDPQAPGLRREIYQEKISGSAELSVRGEAPRTIEEFYPSSTFHSELPGRTSLSRDQAPTSTRRDPLYGDLAQGPSFKPSFSVDLFGSQKRGKSEAKTGDSPSSSSKLDGDRAAIEKMAIPSLGHEVESPPDCPKGIQDSQDSQGGDDQVKDDIPDATGRISKASPRSDLSDGDRTALAVGDDGRSLISRITDVASSNTPSVSHGVGQSDAGGIAGAVVGGVGMAVGGGSFYYQRRQLKLKEKEIELRETESGMARRQADIEQRLSQIEKKEASQGDESKQLKEAKQDLETKELSLTREREALELQRREILAKRSTAEEEFAGREEALKAREVEMCNRAKEVERGEGLKQDYTNVVQKKDVELQELTSHNQKLEASHRDLLGKVAQLSETLLDLESNERRWNSELARLFLPTRALEDGWTDAPLDNISLSTDEMLREARQRFDSLRNAHIDAKCTQRDYIEQLHRVRGALASSEEEKRQNKQNHKEEVVTLRNQCSNLKEQLRIQQETTTSNSPSLSITPEVLRSMSPSEEVDYNQEIQDALEQVSRLKQRFEALQNRKTDSKSKQRKTNANIRLEPVIRPHIDLASGVTQTHAHKEAHSTVSDTSESSEDSCSDGNLGAAPDSNTSGSVHDASPRDDRHNKYDTPASDSVQEHSFGSEGKPFLVTERNGASSSQSNLADTTDSSSSNCEHWKPELGHDNILNESETARVVDSIVEASAMEKPGGYNRFMTVEGSVVES